MNAAKPARDAAPSQDHLEGGVIDAALSSPQGETAGLPDDNAGHPASIPHLVIKRGHLGRYRFAFFGRHGRLTGEVRVADRGADRAGQEADARAEIRKIIMALMVTIE